MNIILIGTMAAGKSTVGEAISKMSEYKFVDTDELVKQRVKADSWNIFKAANEFTKAEREVLKEVAMGDNQVIATGALATSYEGTLESFRKNGVIVRLHPDVETVVQRFKKSKSFFLVAEGQTYEEAVERDYHRYQSQYLDYDYSIDVSDEETPETYAKKILKLLEAAGNKKY